MIIHNCVEYSTGAWLFTYRLVNIEVHQSFSSKSPCSTCFKRYSISKMNLSLKIKEYTKVYYSWRIPESCIIQNMPNQMSCIAQTVMKFCQCILKIKTTRIYRSIHTVNVYIYCRGTITWNKCDSKCIKQKVNYWSYTLKHARQWFIGSSVVDWSRALDNSLKTKHAP